MVIMPYIYTIGTKSIKLTQTKWKEITLSNSNKQVKSNKELLLEKMGISAHQVTHQTTQRKTKAPSTEAEIITAKVGDAIEKTLRDNGAKFYKFEYLKTDGKFPDGKQRYKEAEAVKLCIPFKDKDGFFDMYFVDHWNKSLKSADYSELGQ